MRSFLFAILVSLVASHVHAEETHFLSDAPAGRYSNNEPAKPWTFRNCSLWDAETQTERAFEMSAVIKEEPETLLSSAILKGELRIDKKNVKFRLFKGNPRSSLEEQGYEGYADNGQAYLNGEGKTLWPSLYRTRGGEEVFMVTTADSKRVAHPNYQKHTYAVFSGTGSFLEVEMSFTQGRFHAYRITKKCGDSFRLGHLMNGQAMMAHPNNKSLPEDMGKFPEYLPAKIARKGHAVRDEIVGADYFLRSEMDLVGESPSQRYRKREKVQRALVDNSPSRAFDGITE